MAKLEHNDTYILLRVLQIICAVIVTGQVVCIFIPIAKGPSLFGSSFELLLIFTVVLGATSVLGPCFWLFFLRLSDRFPRLVWVELGIDFQFGASWFLMFMIQMQGSNDQAGYDSPKEDLSDPAVRRAVAARGEIEKLWSICQIFIIISGIVWQTSGIMNAHQIWKERKRNRSGNRRGLLAERSFTSLRSKPSTSSTARPAPMNRDRSSDDFDPSIIHLQPVSPSFDVEARGSPINGTMRGRAL